MQDELKKVISQAMNTNFEFEQEPTTQFAEAELSDEALETVAGGYECVGGRTNIVRGRSCRLFTFKYNRNANGLV